MMVAFVEDGAVRNHELRLRGAYGRVVWVSASMATVESDDDDLLLTIFVDITAAKRAEEELSRSCDNDALTGLPNLRTMLERLAYAADKARRHHQRIAILFIGLEGLGSLGGLDAIGEACGDEAGDVVLRCVAERLKSALGEGDAVGRIGGDEFAALLTGIDGADEADLVSDRILASLSRPIALAGGDVTIGANIGIALYPDHHDEPEVLLRLAFSAMYRAKRTRAAVFAAGSASASRPEARTGGNP